MLGGTAPIVPAAGVAVFEVRDSRRAIQPSHGREFFAGCFAA